MGARVEFGTRSLQERYTKLTAELCSRDVFLTREAEWACGLEFFFIVECENMSERV